VEEHDAGLVPPASCNAAMHPHVWCRYFNSVQSAVFPVAFGSDINMVKTPPPPP